MPISKTKKIIYLAKKSFPSKLASCVNIINMVSSFSKINYEAILYAQKSKSYKNIYDLKKFYGINEDFQFLDLNYYFNISKGFLFRRDFHKKNILKISPDIIYFRDHGIKDFTSLVLNSNIPFVVECHLPLGSSKSHFDKLVNSKNLKLVVVISNNLKKYFLNLYPFLKEKIILMHDAAPFPKKECQYIHKKKEIFNIGYIGNLYKGKCMEMLILISPILAKDIKIHIFGGTKQDIKKWQIKLQRNNITNIVFHGFINRGSLESKIGNIDCFIAPFSEKVLSSGGQNLIEWMSPIKIFEYMSFKRPIISTNLKNLSDVLLDEKNCLLCSSGCPEDWVKAINRIKSNKELSEKIVSNAYDDFLKNYNWDVRAQKIIDKISNFN